MAFLKHVKLSGFKSIKALDLELRPLSVLIGANGSGKSNLISFFKLIRSLFSQRLQYFVAKSGGADALLFYGAKATTSITAGLDYYSAGEATGIRHHMDLTYAAPDTLRINEQVHWLKYDPKIVGHPEGSYTGVGHRESQLPAMKDDPIDAYRAYAPLVPSCETYQFDDTSETAGIRRSVYLHDNALLQHDAGNLAAVLYKLQQTQPDHYRAVLETIRQVVPWFGEFAIRPLELNKDRVQLDWRERGPEKLFGPHQLPDGALRAMALITLLLQPKDDLPELLVLDEPELGLHPVAINVVAALLKAVAVHRQVLIATQSPFLLDQFEPDDVIVVEREPVPDKRQQWESRFERLKPEELTEWLAEYSLSELWEKNVLGGGPL
jgi:predicted ATPase